MSDNQTPITDANVKPIGYLEINNGSVEVQSASGEVRTVLNGGVIFFGDKFVANNTTGGKIVFFDGVTEDVLFGTSDLIDINGEVYNQGDLDALAAESAAEAEALQDAILQDGADPTQIQEAPAAGEESGEYDDENAVNVTIARNQGEGSIGGGFDTLFQPDFGYDTDAVYTARVSFTYNGADSEAGSRFGTLASLSSDDSEAAETAAPAPIFTSYFVDGLVNGLTYTTSSGLTGLTGANGDGSFDYREGDTITFSVGGVVVGSVTSDEIEGQYLFLQDIADTELSDVNSNYVENMAIFLQAIQEGLKDSDTGANDDDGVLQTNDLVNYDEVSGVISISEATRTALADVDLNIEEMDKEDLSDLLATLSIEFTRESEIADGLDVNEFETIAMEHVAENIEAFAADDRTPEEFDERTPDTIEFNQGTVEYNYSDVKSNGELTFKVSDLVNGVVVNQVFSENLAVTDVSLGAEFEGLGELVDNEDGTYTIHIDDEKLEELTPYDLEGLNFDFTVNDWTASYSESSSAAVDQEKSHLSTNITTPVSEGDDYAQFTLSSTLTFNEAQSLNVTFTSELLSGELGKQIAEYADDFSMPFEYSTDGGETWLSATLNSVEFIGDVAWPTFGVELPANASSIEVRIPLFDDVELEGTEYLNAVITGEHFYDEEINIEITDNDTVDTTDSVVSIDYVYAIEGQEYAEFTVSLSTPSDTDVTVDYDVLGMGATAGEDYENAKGTVTIPAGQTSVVIQVPIMDDLDVENMEMAFVTLSNVTGEAVLGDMQGSLRIFDNDGETALTVSLSLDDITEDNILNASETAETYAVTGTLSGDDFALAVISLNINGQAFSVNTSSDGVFSIDVPTEVLIADGDLTIEANAIAYNENGDKGVASIDHAYEINLAPEAQDAVATLVENEISLGTIDVTDTDLVDQGNLTYFVAGTAPAGFSIDESGNYALDTASYDYLSAGEVQDILVNIVVEDTMGNQDVAQLTFTVTGTNDLPSVEGLSQYVLETSVFNGRVDAEDVDLPTGESLTYTLSEDITGLTINSDGSYSFDATDYAYLKTGELLSLSTTLTVTDEQGASATASLNFNVIGISVGAIIAGTDIGDVTEDVLSLVTGTLTISDDDANEASFVEQNDVSSTFGTFSINDNGEWTYNLIDSPSVQGLGVGTTLTDTITVTSVGGDTHSVTITINGTNDAPTIAASEGSTLTENLANAGDTVATFTATDLDGDTVTFSISSGNEEGYFEIDPATGSVTLTALGAAAVNSDTLTDTVINLGVTASDETSTSDEAFVSISLDGINDVPTIDTATGTVLTENAGVEGAEVVQITATDLDGDSITYSITSGNDDDYFIIDEDSGVVTLTAAGALALGNDALTDTNITLGVTASDGTATSEEQNVTISLSAVDDVTTLDLSLGEDLIEGASEVGAIVASFVVSDPDNIVTVDFADDTNDSGYYEINGNNIVLTDEGKVALDLGQSLPPISLVTSGSETQAVAKVKPTVNLINDAPVAVDDLASVIEDGGVITIDVLANDYDEEGDDINIISVSVPESQGTAIVSDGKILFTPALNFNGAATISYTISDGELTNSAEVSVSVSAVDDASVITGDTESVVYEEDSRVVDGLVFTNGNLTVTDVDIDDTPSFDTESVVSADGNLGSLVINEAGEWTYTVDAANELQHLAVGQTLIETFTIAATDGSTETISVTVRGQDDDSVIAEPNQVISFSEDIPSAYMAIPFSLTISDVDDGDTPRFETTTVQGDYGYVEYVESTTEVGSGIWTYHYDYDNGQTLESGIFTEIFTLTATDETEYKITVNINGVNDVPVVEATAEYLAIEGGDLLEGQVDATDVDSENLTFAVTSGEQPGFTLNSDGSWSFDPTVSAFDSLADGVTQDISVDVQVSDGTNTVSQTITITITGTNDVPTATEVVNESVVEGGTSISGVIDASDVDGDSLSYSIIGDTPAGFVLDGDSWTFDPSNVAYNSLAAGITETVSVEVLVDDGNGGTATQVVNLTVTGTNDTPTVDTGSVQSIDEVSLDSSSPNSIQGSYTVADSDGDSISISLVEPTSTYSSQGQDLVWSLSDDGSQLVGALAGLAIVTVALTDMTDEGGNYSVTLNGPIDHLSGASVENISLEFGIAIDDGVSSVTETISVTVNDDVPTAVTTEATLDLSSVTTEPDSAESYSISSISGSFSSADFTSAANKKTGSIDVDQDGDVDYVGWKDTDGKYFSYSSNSNYYADDADSQSDIAMGENFVVAEFTHNNTGINSNYSTLDSVDFDMTFTVEIDGVETSVSLTLPLDHDETLNTLNNGNDTVTITSLPSTTVELNGVTYEVSLTGFMDSNGNLVTTISTPEESSSTYSIVANIDVLTADIDGATGSIDDGTVIDDSIDEVNDTASTILSGTVDIDAGADGLANVVANSTTDVNGTLVISEDGSYIFTPSTELINSDTDVTLTYQYTVLDNDGDSVVNTLTIDVVGSPAENTAPEAADDVSVGDEDSVITIDVLVNDSDAENDGLTITSATVAEELGTVEIVNGKLEFTPADDFSGEVTIDYAISDGELTSQASVTVTVDAVADAPTLEVELSDAVSQGSITLNPDDISSLGEVRSEGYVNGVTSRDSREVDFAFGEEYAGQTVTISFDSFISGGWEDGSNGSTVDTYTILVNGEQVNQYTYEQNTGTATHNQQDSYQVALDDEGNATVQFITHTTDILETVDITNIQASVDSTTSISQLTIKGASTDADGSEVLSYEISALPEGANLLDADGAVITANADGSYSLTAYEADGLQISTSQDASGFDIEVTVTATDGQSTSQTSQTVTVEDSNTNPVAIDDYGFAGLVGSYYGTDTQIDSLDEFINVIANNDPTATFNATNIDYSSNGSTSEATSVATGTNLQTFLGDDADSLSSDPDDNTDGGIHLQGYIFLAAGTYNFQVYADDGYQISIDGENVASVSNNQSPTSTTHQEFEIAEDGYYAIDMIWWDQGGNYVFQPSISSDGGETYTTLDSSMLSSIKGAPLSTDDEHSITINPETLLANDSDADGDVLSISSISDVQDGYAYLNSEGSVVFIAAAGFTGTASFDYTITDGNGGFDTATAFVEVTESAILPTVTVTLSETQETSAGGNGWGGFTADDENISTPTNDEGNYTTWESYTSDSENIYIEENVTASLQTQGGNDQVVIGGNAVEYINLGAGDDKIRIEGTLGSDDIETSLDAGAGNDDVYIDGDVKEYINLGNGDDLLVIGGLVEWEIESGDGNDSLLLNGYTAATYATEKSLPTSKLESRISDFTNIMLGDGTVIKGDASAFDDYFTGSTSDTDIPTYSYDLNVDINNENATAEGATVNLFGIPATVTVLLNGETLTSNTDGSYSIDVEQDQTSISGLSIVSDAELPEFEVTSTVTNRVDETDVDVDEIIATDSFQSGTDAIDTLVGLDGDDVLFGGDDEAADILTGGAGNDVFILNDVAVQSNIDTITDFNAADDALDLTDLLSGIEGNPGKDADMDAITEFLEAHVKVEDGAVKVDDEDVAKFGVDDDSLTDSVTTSFDSNGDGSVNSSDSIKVIYNNEEYNINIDG